MLERLRGWARRLKLDVMTLWLAARDPRTPWQVRALAGAVAAYALSPIDLIPDFIPIVGYLDDILLLPLGIWLAIRLIPVALLAELRARAAAIFNRPSSRWAGAVVIAVWIAVLAMLTALGWTAFGPD